MFKSLADAYFDTPPNQTAKSDAKSPDVMPIYSTLLPPPPIPPQMAGLQEPSKERNSASQSPWTRHMSSSGMAFFYNASTGASTYISPEECSSFVGPQPVPPPQMPPSLSTSQFHSTSPQGWSAPQPVPPPQMPPSLFPPPVTHSKPKKKKKKSKKHGSQNPRPTNSMESLTEDSPQVPKSRSMIKSPTAILFTNTPMNKTLKKSPTVSPSDLLTPQTRKLKVDDTQTSPPNKQTVNPQRKPRYFKEFIIPKVNGMTALEEAAMRLNVPVENLKKYLIDPPLCANPSINQSGSHLNRKNLLEQFKFEKELDAKRFIAREDAVDSTIALMKAPHVDCSVLQ